MVRQTLCSRLKWNSAPVLTFVEQVYIGTNNGGYNAKGSTPSTAGMKHTKEARAKMRAFRLGRKLTPEHAEKLRAANRGRPKADHEKAILRKAHTGKKMSDASKQKMREAKLGPVGRVPEI